MYLSYAIAWQKTNLASPADYLLRPPPPPEPLLTLPPPLLRDTLEELLDTDELLPEYEDLPVEEELLETDELLPEEKLPEERTDEPEETAEEPEPVEDERVAL